MRCGWRGPHNQRVQHEQLCPFTRVECSWCLLEMAQYLMPGHACPRIDAQEDCCYICMQPFGQLLTKSKAKVAAKKSQAKMPVLPAIPVLGGRRSCTCPRPNQCMTCARGWLCNETGSKTCAFCQQPYDGVAALALHLVTNLDKKIEPGQTCLGAVGENRDAATTHAREDASVTARPSSTIPLVHCAPVGSLHWVSPLDLRFTHDSVKYAFRDFMDRDTKSLQKDKSILDSLEELLTSHCGTVRELPRTLECLDVCWYDDSSGGTSQPQLYLAGTGNRRLTMWRLLAIFRDRSFGLIKVRMVDRLHPRVKFQEKCTTRCAGRWIAIRPNVGGKGRCFFVGRQREADAGWAPEAAEGKDPGVQWPAAVKLFEKYRAK